MVTNEPFFAEQAGRKVRTLSLASAGYDCYHAIFCRKDLIVRSPEVIAAFVQASIRGWHDYLFGNPAPGDALILRSNPQMTPALLQYSRSEMIIRQLVQGDRANGEGIGQLSMARLGQEMDLLLNLRIMSVPIAVSSVATRQFLPPAPP